MSQSDLNEIDERLRILDLTLDAADSVEIFTNHAAQLLVDEKTSTIIRATSDAEGLLGHIAGTLKFTNVDCLVPARHRPVSRTIGDSHVSAVRIVALCADGIEVPVDINFRRVQIKDSMCVVITILRPRFGDHPHSPISGAAPRRTLIAMAAVIVVAMGLWYHVNLVSQLTSERRELATFMDLQINQARMAIQEHRDLDAFVMLDGISRYVAMYPDGTHLAGKYVELMNDLMKERQHAADQPSLASP